MALKDRFNIMNIETDRDDYKEQVVTETLVEADLGPVFDELAGSLSEKVASIPVWFDYSQEEQRKLISDFLTHKLENEYSDISFSNEEKGHIISLFMNSVRGFGELDSYLTRDEVKSLFVNSDGSIYIDNGTSIKKESATISQYQFERIYSGVANRLKRTDKSLMQLSLNKLVITLLNEPLTDKKIIFEKLKTDKVDFLYLLNDGSLDKNVCDFIKALVANKQNILVAGKASSGKTALVSAIAGVIDENSRCAILENYPIINSEIHDKYYIKGLSENELSDLFNVTKKLKYDYVINDTEYLPAVLDESFGQGYYASLDADSLTQAITKLAGYKVYNEKCTEKQAKASITSKFNYLFLLENDDKSLFKIASVVQLSLNKTGSLVMSEVVKYSNGTYECSFIEE